MSFVNVKMDRLYVDTNENTIIYKETETNKIAVSSYTNELLTFEDTEYLQTDSNCE